MKGKEIPNTGRYGCGRKANQCQTSKISLRTSGTLTILGGLSKGIWQLREGGVVNFPLSRPKRGKLFLTLFRPQNQYFLLHLRSLRLMEVGV